jgi:hypothetical protein
MIEALKALGVFCGVVIAALVLSKIFEIVDERTEDYWEDGE